jgi:hypothetical protein
LLKEQESLRSRGKRMLDHDTSVIDRFDTENPDIGDAIDYLNANEINQIGLSPGFLMGLEDPIKTP